MKAVEVAEDLFFIERGYLSGNHFLYKGDPPVLIDTAYYGAFDETKTLLADLGVRPEDVGRIITTHIHCDHVGGHTRIQKQSGCEIRLNPIGRYFMETWDDQAMWYRYFGQQAEQFRCHGSLEDGDSFFIGPHEFLVMHTPGHSADNTVFYCEKEKLLISGDALWEYDIGVIPVRVEGHAAPLTFHRSVKRIARMEVKTVCPGHGPVFTDFEAAVDRTVNRLEKYMANRTEVGEDLLRRIMVYTLLMRGEVEADGFFWDLMDIAWFRETIELYEMGDHESKYHEVVSGLVMKGVIEVKEGKLVTTVKA